MDLIHHGLITVERNHDRIGIYWLRLYGGDLSNNLAVITEVPGNRGGSVVNRIAEIARSVVRQSNLAAKTVTWFSCFPEGCMRGSSANYKRVVFSQPQNLTGPGWEDSTRTQIEDQVGIALAPIPSHEILLRQVLELGGSDRYFTPSAGFKVVPSADLPPPHSPSSCVHYDRFQQIEATMKNPHDELEPGRMFLESLTDKDFKTCRYHKAKWKEIADLSVAFINESGWQPTDEQIDHFIESAHLGESDDFWLYSFFADPISINGGSYTNGQHRGCALRGSKASHVVVRDYGEDEEIIDVWTFLGD